MVINAARAVDATIGKVASRNRATQLFELESIYNNVARIDLKIKTLGLVHGHEVPRHGRDLGMRGWCVGVVLSISECETAAGAATAARRKIESASVEC
jgi:hypothetical protein